jgi:hypothetical protein
VADDFVSIVHASHQQLKAFWRADVFYVVGLGKRESWIRDTAAISTATRRTIGMPSPSSADAVTCKRFRGHVVRRQDYRLPAYWYIASKPAMSSVLSSLSPATMTAQLTPHSPLI